MSSKASNALPGRNMYISLEKSILHLKNILIWYQDTCTSICVAKQVKRSSICSKASNAALTQHVPFTYTNLVIYIQYLQHNVLSSAEVVP
jgi:hypothetical protein